MHRQEQSVSGDGTVMQEQRQADCEGREMAAAEPLLTLALSLMLPLLLLLLLSV